MTHINCVVTTTITIIVSITLVHESGDELAVLASRRFALKKSRHSFPMSLRTEQDCSQ